MRPRREDETFEEYRANLKKEALEELEHQRNGVNFIPNKVFKTINGKLKILPQIKGDK